MICGLYGMHGTTLMFRRLDHTIYKLTYLVSNKATTATHR